MFQRYSTLDAVSGGRAEVILGRGSYGTQVVPRVRELLAGGEDWPLADARRAVPR